MSSHCNKREYMLNKIQSYYKTKHQKKYINKHYIQKRIVERNATEFGRIYNSIITRINKVFNDNKLEFNVSYIEIIGCSIEDLESFSFGKFVLHTKRALLA